MKCPSCGDLESKVIDSRSLGDEIRRRRECIKCRERFTTYERVQNRGLYVIKKDGRREDFNREKLFSGIRKACEKRPMPTGTIEAPPAPAAPNANVPPAKTSGWSFSLVDVQ